MEINSGLEKLAILKNKLRNKYPLLTKSDLSTSPGNENQMFTMVAYKLRKTRKELMKIISEL